MVEVVRRLAVIMMADVVAYSRLMGADEAGTHRRVQAVLHELIEPTVTQHRGRIVKQRGDGFLSIFDSPVEALRSAIIIQQQMVRQNMEVPAQQAIKFRIGINLGDVIVEADDIYGDGVNLAARIEALAPPGEILISAGVYEQVKNKLVCGYQSFGERKVKNIVAPVLTYRILQNGPEQKSTTGSKSSAIVQFVAEAVSRVKEIRIELNKQMIIYGTMAVLGLSGIVGAFMLQSSPIQPPTVEARAPDLVQEAKIILAPPRPTEPAPASPVPLPVPAPAPVPPPIPAPVAPPPVTAQSVTEPKMITINGAVFQMGSRDDASEQPIHGVVVRTFLLAKYPTTIAQWLECVRDKACSFVPTGNPDAPLTNVSWTDAQQYIAWLSQVTHQTYRLPTEAEWEYAARGGTETRFWWGDTMKPGYANCRGCGDSTPLLKLGTHPANPFGLSDINGGISEWVQDCWVKDYRGAPVDGSARITPRCAEHVLRGGAWNNDQNDMRSASRNYYDSSVRYVTHGFRVARSEGVP